MNNLWAPWRKEYITCKKISGCFFCKAIKEKNDKKNLLLFRGKEAIIILNKFPYNNGHIMIAPKRHIGEIEKLTKVEIVEIFSLCQKMILMLKNTLKPGGFNVGINIGKVSGAGVEKHIHIHIVPRWLGDTNFMPIFAKTRVISQSLEELYELLHSEINKVTFSRRPIGRRPNGRRPIGVI